MYYRYGVAIFCLFLISGCAKRYSPTALTPVTASTADEMRSVDGVTVYIKKVKKFEYEDFFTGVSPLSEIGTQPVHYTFINSTADYWAITLEFPAQPVSFEDVIQELKHQRYKNNLFVSSIFAVPSALFIVRGGVLMCTPSPFIIFSLFNVCAGLEFFAIGLAGTALTGIGYYTTYSSFDHNNAVLAQNIRNYASEIPVLAPHSTVQYLMFYNQEESCDLAQVVINMRNDARVIML